MAYTTVSQEFTLHIIPSSRTETYHLKNIGLVNGTSSKLHIMNMHLIAKKVVNRMTRPNLHKSTKPKEYEAHVGGISDIKQQ